MKYLATFLVSFLLMESTMFAGEVGFIEDFALARDRAASLRQLIPGTEDYYYYHCLHLLNTGQFDKTQEFTRPWLERCGKTPRLVEIQTRQALLTYDRNPQRSLDYLRQQLSEREIETTDDAWLAHVVEQIKADPNFMIDREPEDFEPRHER